MPSDNVQLIIQGIRDLHYFEATFSYKPLITCVASPINENPCQA